jgi:hypothetical protein
MMPAIRQIEHEIAAGTSPAQISETLSAEQLEIRRKFCDWLALWRNCERSACRRGRACGGDPARCFVQFYADCPEPMRVWVRAGSFCVEEGSSARAATRMADTVLVTHLKHVTGLPQLTRRKRRGVDKGA